MIPFSDAVYNSLLWTPGKVAAKGSTTQGEVMIREGLMYSTDGHVFLRVEVDVYLEGWIAGGTLKEVKNDKQLEEGLLSSPSGDRRFWNGIPDLFDDLVVFAYRGGFAITPERLSKFSLLRPRAAFPVDMAHAVTKDDQAVVAFKYGPDVFGMFAPLDRDHLEEVYSGQTGVLW